jgi:DNA-nicking Smr family endonuclease
VLKDKVKRWLVQSDRVLAFVQARADEGGVGALVVLLQTGKTGSSAIG